MAAVVVEKEEDGDRDRNWDFHLRSLSMSARDSSSAANDPSLLHSVKKLYKICKEEKSEDLMARVYPHLNKLFQRSITSLSQSQSSYGLLLLFILSGDQHTKGHELVAADFRTFLPCQPLQYTVIFSSKGLKFLHLLI